MDLVRSRYKPLSQDIFRFDPEMVLSNAGNIDDIKFETIGNEVFALPVFKKDFCTKLLTELRHFKSLDIPHAQPNSMNKHGVLLDEIGFKDFFDDLRTSFIQPLSRRLYQEPNLVLDSHKAFVVKYALGEDVELANHFDNSEITLNISISDDYDGGELVFNTINPSSGNIISRFGYEHELGQAVLHR